MQTLLVGGGRAVREWPQCRDARRQTQSAPGSDVREHRTVKARKEATGGVRRILEADLWEISVVTFPMLPGARVSQVKGFGARQALPTIREFERWLTRDAGLTRGDARAVITRGFASLMRERDAAPDDPSALARKIRKAATLFQ